MKKYRVTIAALLALVALGAAALLFSLASGAVQDLRRQSRRGQQAALRLQEQELAKATAEHGEWRRLPEDLRRFHARYIITLDDFARFRRDLNLRLDDNNLRAPNIAFKFERRRGGLQPVNLQFTLNGSYRSLKKFIYDMELLPRMAFFHSIEMNRNGDAISGRFTMEAYLGE